MVVRMLVGARSGAVNGHATRNRQRRTDLHDALVGVAGKRLLSLVELLVPGLAPVHVIRDLACRTSY